jgi:pimeloyl-ACP methyl ester carboxylesterase
VDISGKGPRLLLMHGSHWHHPSKNFVFQRELGDAFQVVIPHRRGYGESAAALRTPAFEPDVSDALALLDGRAHLVGDSYAGVVALLATAQSPQRVASLTLIEPPLFQLAGGTPAADALLSDFRQLYAQRSELAPQAFAAGFLSALRGETVGPRRVSDESLNSLRAMMTECEPWTAPLDLSTIKRLPVTKHVVSGGWHPAFEALCDALAAAIGADRTVISGAGHSPQNAQNGAPFNQLLRSLR